MPALEKKYPPELKDRAVRLVLAARDADGARGARGARARAGDQLGICPDALHDWVPRAEINVGERPSITTDETLRMAELERDNPELRCANAILRSASALFTAGPDRHSTR